MEQYEAYTHSSSYEEVPLYLFDRNFATNTNVSETERKFNLSDDYTVPTYFTTSTISSPSIEATTTTTTAREYKTDLFSILPEDIRPDYRWLIIGPLRSGSIFHLDPNQTHAWNACIKGRKKWIFYPPTVVPPGVYVSKDGSDVTVPLSTGEWLLSFWKYHLLNRPQLLSDSSINQRYGSFNYTKPLEVIVEEGELIFVPHGWWHMVVNLDNDCIALTQNYVSETNLVDCYEFLKDKSDQISGLRDCYNTDEFKQNFYQIFEEKLKSQYPNLYQEMIEKYSQRIQEKSNNSRQRKLNEIFSRKKQQKTQKIEENKVYVENGDDDCNQFLSDLRTQRRKRSNSNYSDDNTPTKQKIQSYGNSGNNNNNKSNSNSNASNSSNFDSNSNTFSFSFNFSE